MEKPNQFYSHHAAARALGVSPYSMTKLARLHGLTIRQIPGHSRRYFVRAEIEALAAKAFITGARA